MPRLTFIEPDGTRREVEAESGKSILQTCRRHGVDIEGAVPGAALVLDLPRDPGTRGFRPPRAGA